VYFGTEKKENIFFGLAPPLGLLYIARVLKDQGDKVTILDFSAEPFEEQKIVNGLEKADVVGITVLSFSIENVVDVIKIIRKTKPEIKVIIGGPHCTLFPKEALEETWADISVQGDGEAIITEIKKAIEGEKSFSDIAGIYYKDKNEIKEGLAFELVNNLDSVSFPARELVEKYIYGREYNPKIKKGEFTSIVTTRGCPHNCTFCSRNSISMKKYRTRSAKNILDELKSLSKKGYKYVAFEDDCFLANKKIANELFDKIIKEKINMKFIITAARVDSADEELYMKMKYAGVTHLQYGLESGNQDVLDFYNKKTSVDQIRYAVNLSHKMGFFTIGSFIIGAPFETKDHFNNTVNFAKTLPLESVSFLPLRYIAGSKLWCDAVEEKKISEKEYVVLADSKRGLGAFTKEEIAKYCRNTSMEFYLRPQFFLRLLIKSLKNNDLGFLQSYISLFFSRKI